MLWYLLHCARQNWAIYCPSSHNTFTFVYNLNTIYKRDRYIFFFLLHTALSSVSCFFSYLIHFVIFWRNLSCKLTPLRDKELARLSVRSLNTRVIDHVSNLTTLVVQPLGAMVHLLKTSQWIQRTCLIYNIEQFCCTAFFFDVWLKAILTQGHN